MRHVENFPNASDNPLLLDIQQLKHVAITSSNEVFQLAVWHDREQRYFCLSSNFIQRAGVDEISDRLATRQDGDDTRAVSVEWFFRNTFDPGVDWTERFNARACNCFCFEHHFRFDLSA